MGSNKQLIKTLALLFLSAPLLWPLEILQSVGVEGKEPFVFITLEESTPFNCILTPPSLHQKGELDCTFDRVPAIRPKADKNGFFEITPLLQENRFGVKMRFLKKARVYPMESATLAKTPLVPADLNRKAKRWLVVGYEKTPPVLSGEEARGLGFPIELPDFDPPAVGPLDLTGAPVMNRSARDEGQEYAQVNAAYEAGNLPETLRLINRTLEAGKGRNLFLPEMLALKVKVLDRLGESETELIEIAEPWVRAYTVHHELPEIMLILANNLMAIGRSSDALHYYNTLIREYPGNRFADLAEVYRGDRFATEGRVGEATASYEKVLFNSTDVPAASMAASRLAELAIKEDKLLKATELYGKILQGHPEFFLQNITRSRQLLEMMAEQKVFAPAAQLGEILLPKVETGTPEYEKALLELARWQRLGGFKQKAVETYRRYLKEYPFSAQKAVVEKEFDLLRFDLGHETAEENLAHFDRILERYPDDEAASRALYEKAKLLLQLGRYAEVKALLPALDGLDESLFYDYRQQIRQMERTLLDSFLIREACADAVALIGERGIGLSLRSDETLYRCAHQERAYGLALEIADSNLKRTSKAQGIVWLERRMDVLHDMADYPRYIDAAERFLMMQRALRQPVEADRFYQLFGVYHRLRENPERMRELAAQVDYRFPKDPRNMDVYAAMIELSKRLGDTQMQYDFAKKLVNRHRILSVRTFTPESELDFADAAGRLGRKEEGILVLQTLLQNDLEPAVRARVLFALGELLQSDARPELAAAVFKRCADLPLQEDVWMDLCRQKAAL
ncbi:MAG: tetratricopeptide repeat protein [Campylobacterales bacterium]